MKLIRKIIICLFVFSLLFLSSCSAETTYTIKEMDGKYYLNFSDGNSPGPGGVLSSVGNTISFESVAEMKETFSGEKLTDHERASLCQFFPQTDGKGIHFFNIDKLLVPVLPQGFSENPLQVHMMGTIKAYTFYSVLHTMKNDENVTAESFFYPSMKDWHLHMELIFSSEFTFFGADKESSYEFENYFRRLTIQDDSATLQYETYTDYRSARYVMKYTKDGITSVTMFVLEGETFFSVHISGLAESPTVEYLQSFSVKVYED